MKVCLLLAIVPITLISQQSHANNRRKRSNTENFNVLLSIYKMNPLKRSNVYKMFSNRVLLPRPDEQTPDLNYNSNESTKKLNDKNVKLAIEEIRYAPQDSVIDRPLYVDNKTDFDPGHFFNTLINESDNKINNDDAEILINHINYHKEVTSSKFVSNTEGHNANGSERNIHLKVYNLNKIDHNEIDFDDADVLVVK